MWENCHDYNPEVEQKLKPEQTCVNCGFPKFHHTPNYPEPTCPSLPESFGKIPDVRHPDTVLLDWLERRWEADDDGCPIGFDGESFIPLCESGVWPPDMSLRQAIQKAMKIERDRGDE